MIYYNFRFISGVNKKTLHRIATFINKMGKVSWSKTKTFAGVVVIIVFIISRNEKGYQSVREANVTKRCDVAINDIFPYDVMIFSR